MAICAHLRSATGKEEEIGFNILFLAEAGHVCQMAAKAVTPENQWNRDWFHPLVAEYAG